MDLFAEKNLMPMLIAEMQQPFNDKDWIYELKLDGCRCIAYLERNEVILKNKRSLGLLHRFPELSGIYKQLEDRCVLDGELVVLRNGTPDFYELQKRTLLTDKFKIELGASRFPASFVAYDCLQKGNEVLFEIPLIERKKILDGLLQENERIAVSRYVEEKGVELFQLTEDRELEGVVAKRKQSLYYPGKRTRDWIKFKRMEDEDFVVCGYIQKGERVFSIILGKYKGERLVYKGHVTLGVSLNSVRQLKKGMCPFIAFPVGNEHAVWCVPDTVCTVEYMPNTKNALRQVVFKGFREDILPEEVLTE